MRGIRDREREKPFKGATLPCGGVAGKRQGISPGDNGGSHYSAGREHRPTQAMKLPE